MNKLACRYAVVQFMPHAETGEFVNIGIVLACPQTGYFGYKLQTRKHKRVTDFFDELPPEMYRAAVRVIGDELQRVQALLGANRSEMAERTRAFFDRATHPREALIKFGTVRVLLAESPERELARLYLHYVDRDFATREYVEVEMARRLGNLLKTLDLQAPFKPQRIGDDEVHANFPLVQQRGTQVIKVIKPLNLNKQEPNAIYDHGDAWIQKIKRLRSRNLLPEDLLFALAAPPADDSKRWAAFEDIRNELIRLDALTVDEAARDSIVRFAIQ